MSRSLGHTLTDNEQLKSWEWRARELELKLAEVGAIAKVLPEQPLPFVTVRLISQASGPFVRSGMIDAGRRRGLKSGFPVLAAEGLAGRLLETGETHARVLMLTDINSRIPVIVGKQGVRAMLIGDNGPWPLLDFLGGTFRIEPGDDVATSGVGGLFPQGLRVGRVVSAEGEKPRVAPLARFEALNFVSVLMYESPDRLVDAEDKKPKSRPAGARSNRGS